MNCTQSEVMNWSTCLFEDSDIVEIRCFPPRQVEDDLRPREYSWYHTRLLHRFFPWLRADSIHFVAGALLVLNMAQGVRTKWQDTRLETLYHVPLNVFCGANPRTRLGGRTADDVLLARSLFADIDHVSPEEADRRLAAAGLPSPTLRVRSGHGVHVYWRLVAPVLDLHFWTLLQKRLISVLQSDPYIHDPPRMMRLPGFINHNGVPAKVYILDSAPFRRYDVSLLDSLLPPLPVPYRALGPETDSPTGFLTQAVLHRATAYTDRFAPPEDGRRNSAQFDLSANLTEKFDLPVEHVQGLALALNDRCPEPLGEQEVLEVAEKAHRHIHRKGRRRGTALAVVEAEPYHEPSGEIVPLTAWREQMVQRRLDSLRQPGTFHFDGSPPGAGKSTADQKAMRVAEGSITFLPTHLGCQELSADLTETGLPAAPYPPVNEDTCQRFGSKDRPGEARLTQEAGLNVGVTLCPDCLHSKTCLYQKLRQKAAATGHAVATHARSASSQFEPAVGKPVVFIHENWLNTLRPMVRVSAQAIRGAASHRHLRDVAEVSKEAYHQAKDILGDEEKREFFLQVFQSTQDLIQRLEASHQEGNSVPSFVERLPNKEWRKRPERWEYVFFRAMRDSGLNIHGDALRLCVSYACGELDSLCLVQDEKYTKGDGQSQAHKRIVASLVGVWRVDLPAEGVVWFEDGTGDVDLLRRLTGREVQDQTPTGRLAWAVPPVQYPEDVTRNTSPNIFRGLLRGVLALHRDAHKVGLITLRCHLEALKELENRWRERLAVFDYFGSGQDRASNKWLDCDLIVILGTPRVSPAAVRQSLIQTGDFEAAARDGEWVGKAWTGKTTDANLVKVTSLGYKDPDWDRAHQRLVRDAMTQAVGRGRGVTEQGVPVVVLTNEPLGILLTLSPLHLLKDPESRVYEAVVGLTEALPNNTIVGEISVGTRDVAQQVGLTERQTLEYLTKLSSPSLGLLKRKGARGGWLLD